MESLLDAVQPGVYLPSKSEVQKDESASKNEHRFVSNVPRKASLMIDRRSRKYGDIFSFRSWYLPKGGKY